MNLKSNSHVHWLKFCDLFNLYEKFCSLSSNISFTEIFPTTSGIILGSLTSAAQDDEIVTVQITQMDVLLMLLSLVGVAVTLAICVSTYHTLRICFTINL